MAPRSRSAVFAPIVSARRSANYGSRAFANELAKGGFVVLAHDAFLWSSRRFPLEDMPEPMRRSAEAEQNLALADGVPDDVALYDAAAHHHEHLVEKYCRLLGMTLAGVVAREDRVTASYLLSGPDVSEGGLGCVIGRVIMALPLPTLSASAVGRG